MGQFKSDKKHGDAVQIWPDGKCFKISYSSIFLASSIQQFVWSANINTIINKDNQGQFKNDKKNGKGIFTWPDGKRYEVEYSKIDSDYVEQFLMFVYAILISSMNFIWENIRTIRKTEEALLSHPIVNMRTEIQK